MVEATWNSVVKIELIEAARGMVRRGSRTSPDIMPAASAPVNAKAMAAQEFKVSQFQTGQAVWRLMGVAEPWRDPTMTAAAQSRAPRTQGMAPPIFSVHFPILRPIRLVPSAVQGRRREPPIM